MLLAHNPNSGDSEGWAGMSGERETQCSQAHVLSNNIVAELYIRVFQIQRRTNIFKSFLLNSFCMYSIMVHFFSMRTFFVFVHWTAVVLLFILKEKSL